MSKDSDIYFDDNVLNIYRFGSEVYGTRRPDSDEDRIIVAKEYFDSEDINVHVYTVEQFQNLLNNCEIQMLECFFLDTEYILKQRKGFDFQLDKFKLRTSISTIANNSFVKGKKKLIIAGDYDLRLALKSIFHSLRILDFGIQVAENGRISNYKSMNYVLEDLEKMSESWQRNELWDKINEKYKPIFNKMSSRFKELAPKDLSEKNKKSNLIKILEKYNIEENEDLVNELLTVL
jgi:predicted nucleotidyltransferase